MKQQRHAGRPSPLKLSKGSRIVKKAAGVELLKKVHQGPVIIHTYSPKIIQVDTDNFMWLVQKLTGSSDTRLRCQKSRPKCEGPKVEVEDSDDAEDIKKDIQGSVPPEAASSSQFCGSSSQTPSSMFGNISVWSPIPTPNLLLHHDFLRDLPPIFSPSTQQLASWGERGGTVHLLLARSLPESSTQETPDIHVNKRMNHRYVVVQQIV